MRLQTQPTQAFTFFGSYLLERQLITLLKIAERGWEPARDERADDANGNVARQAEASSPHNATRRF
jgi:hypothetical protein